MPWELLSGSPSPPSSTGAAATFLDVVEDDAALENPWFLPTQPSTTPPASVPLLDYYRGLQPNCATPGIRSALSSANRLGVSGVDVLRRQDRGTGDGYNLFCEPARTVYSAGNQAMASAPWSPLNGGTTCVNGSLVSPQGAVDGALLTFGASAVARLSALSPIGVVPVNKDIVFSVWVRVGAGSGKFNLNVTDHDGVTHTSANFTADGFWRRYSFATVSGSNAGATLTMFIGNGGDNTSHSIYVWGAQLELGKDPSSVVLTTSAATTGTSVLGDVYQTSGAFVPSAMRFGRFTISAWLGKDTANVVSGDRFVLLSWVSAANRLELSHDGVDLRFRVFVAGVQVAVSPVVIGGAWATQALVLDAYWGTVRLNGVAGPAGTPWQMPQGPLAVGVEVSGASQWWGEIGEPFAA